jgi:hypothetical protein
MNTLDQMRLDQELKGTTKRTHEYQWTQGELNDAWRAVSAPILRLAEALVNLPDTISTQEIAAIQQSLPATDLATMTPAEYLELCHQLRTAWRALESLTSENKKFVRGEAQSILHSWWRRHPIEPDGPHWNVYFETGTIFPSPNNCRALLARVCFDNREYLGICKWCKKFFIKRRADSSKCLDPKCSRYDNVKRQEKHQAKRKAALRAKGKYLQ